MGFFLKNEQSGLGSSHVGILRSKSKFVGLLVGLACAIALLVPSFAWADSLSCQSGEAHGTYKHPVTGEVADSAGVVGATIGQGMIDKVVGSSCLLESGKSTWLDLRFNLTGSISNIRMERQEPNDGSWEKTAFQVVSQSGDSANLRVLVASADSILKVSMHVNPIGRDVTFFISADSWKAGNAGKFERLSKNDEAALIEAFSAELSNGQGASAQGQSSSDQGDNESATQSGLQASGGDLSAGASSGASLDIPSNVWVTLFLVVFCASFCAGALLLLIVFLLRGRRRKKPSMAQGR